MGPNQSNTNTKVVSNKPPPKNTTNFGKNVKLDPKDFTCSKLTNETFIRVPNTINNQQFIIEECTNCDIYLLDLMGCLTIGCVDIIIPIWLYY